MKSSEPTPRNAQGQCRTQETGLPWFRTWRSVYLFVLGSFVIWVALLYLLSVCYA